MEVVSHDVFASNSSGQVSSCRYVNGTPNVHECRWPSCTSQVMSVKCPDPKELVCLAVSHPLVAVGSQRFITFLDMRCGHIAKSVASADEAWGRTQHQTVVLALSFCL